jgi:adenylate cyclase
VNRLIGGFLNSLGNELVKRHICSIWRHSLGLAIVLAACIFLVDTLSSLQFAVASLYVVVVLLVARDLDRRGIIITSLACASLTVLSYGLIHGLKVDGASPLRFMVSLFVISITTILVVRNHLGNERLKEVERKRANLARFFSPKIIEQVAEDSVFSTSQIQPAAVLFVDMIGFTSYSSDKSPAAVIGMLRELLGLLGEAVFAHQGSIDKFTGDGLIAVFGPPLTSLRDATNASACALEMLDSVNRWNQRHARSAMEAVRIAIGIHYGEVVQGNVGTDKRLEFTVVGDTVNIASRVEAHCRLLGASVLVTGQFVQALRAEGAMDIARDFKDEGLQVLRDRTQPIRLFSLKREEPSPKTSRSAN